MGGQQNRFALLQQQLQPLPHQVPRLRVQAGGWLVQQQQFGIVHQRARQAQAPFHSARELAGFGVGLGGQRRKLQQRRNARADRRVLHAEVAPVDQQVFRAGEVRIQRIHLRHHPDLRLDRQLIARHLQAQGMDAAAIGRGQPQAHADRGRLAGPVGPDHPQALTRRNRE